MAVRREGDQLTRKAERYTRPCWCSLTKASFTPAASTTLLSGLEFKISGRT